MGKNIVLCDLNGVLTANSERIKEFCLYGAIWAAGGRTNYDPKFFASFMGSPGPVCRKQFIERAQPPNFDESRIRRVFIKLYDEFLGQGAIQIREGAIDFLRDLKSTGCLLGLVTTTPRIVAQQVLGPFMTPGELFHFLVLGDEGSDKKPHPGPYIRARHLVAPITPQDRIFAIEDSITGVSAAQSAKIPVILLRHDLNEFQDFPPVADSFSSFSDPDQTRRIRKLILD